MKDFESYTVGERVKYVRKELGFTLDKFGDKIGAKKSTMSAIETGRNAVTEQMKRSICREFHVSYMWLSDGVGDVFSNNDAALKDKVDRIMESENDFHKQLLKSIIDLDDDILLVLKDLVDKLANKKTD